MLVRRFVVAERSMAPTLEPGDRIITWRRPPRPGDLAVATAPDGRRVVKRVVAIGPSDVVVSDERLLVDGYPHRWSAPDGTPGAGRWQLSEGQAFLLSDAPRRTDADSRAWGPVADDALDGVVVWRYRPWRRWGRPT